MNTEPLAPIFLDDKPVALKDPKPKVAAVLVAGGRPNAPWVTWLRTQSDTQGKTLRPEEVLDRTSEPTKAIYLTSIVRAKPSAPVEKLDNAPTTGWPPGRPGALGKAGSIGATPARTPPVDDLDATGFDAADDDMAKGNE